MPESDLPIDEEPKSTLPEMVRVSLGLTVKSRTHFSIQHIQAAALFSRLSGRVEQEYSGSFDDALFSEHRAYVTSAILSATAFLEATVNELFSDAVDHPGGVVHQLGAETVSLMASMWQIDRTESFSITDKFQIALLLAGKQVFDKGTKPFQDVFLLIQLRNALIHYKPEWVITSHQPPSGAPSKQATLTGWEKAFRGKFSLNPLTSVNNSYFPDKCLSHGCAAWGVRVSVQFCDEFCRRLDLRPPYEHVRGRLATSE